MVTKIISGAQTGADRAGLDAGLALGMLVGGWVPRGRRTDDGSLTLEEMARYNLSEHVSPLYPPRTEQNVRESDGTVLFGNMSSPGCTLTIRLCKAHHKPYLPNPVPSDLHDWAVSHDITIINVAGNRERTNPGIYQLTYNILLGAFS